MHTLFTVHRGEQRSTCGVKLTEVNETAIQILEQRAQQILADAKAQANEIYQAIARLRGAKGVPSTATISFPEVRPGQWRGMDLRAAMIQYLNERPGGVLTTRVASDLVRGGVEVGKKKQ